MAEFKVDQQVMAHGVIVRIADCGQADILVKWGKRCDWMLEDELVLVAAPVTVRCDKCSIERPLTDFPSMRDRGKALGLPDWNITLDKFMEVYRALKVKGVTAEQFVEGL